MKFMRRIAVFLRRRAVVLSLIGCILAAAFLAIIFPQEISNTPWEIEKWRRLHPLLAAWRAGLGLGHVFTTPAFLIVLILFFTTLFCSTIRQIKFSWRKTAVIPDACPVQAGYQSTKDITEVKAICRKMGYIHTAGRLDRLLFIKHPWGGWGNALLHGSLMLIVAAAILILLLQQRGVLRLIAGETFSRQDQWFFEEHGRLNGVLKLPFALRLDRVVPEYWPNDDLKALTSVIRVKYAGRPAVQSTLSITQSRYFSGIRLFQSANYGLACSLSVKGGNGYREDVVMMFKNAPKRDTPQYEEIGLPATRLQAKYFPDADRKSMLSQNPLLVLRLRGKQGSAVSAQRLELRPGQSGALGRYKIRFNNFSRWISIIFIRLYAMPLVFAGFILLAVGATLIFFCPPRRLIVIKRAGGLDFSWSATKFPIFYREEGELLLSRLLK